jgi:hypothetical protein
MSIISELLNTLKNETSKELVLPDALTFPTINLEKLELTVELEVNAKKNGEINQPETEAINLDYTQQQIIEKATSAFRPFQSAYMDALNAYNSRLAALDPLGFDAKIRGLASQKKAEIQMIAAQAKGEIYLLENNLRQRDKEYQDFKLANNNPADPFETISKTAKYGIILLLLILEGIINSFFLGPFMRGGVMEGLAYALAIPLLSIVFFGLIAGISLRKISIAKPLPKLGHILILSIATLGSLSVTFMLAALRIAVDLSEDYQDITLGIWLSFLQLNPSHQLNTPGILLIAMGLAFFIVAAFDIKALDHPIPGFLQAFKTREKSHLDYNAKMEMLNKKLIQVATTSMQISDSFNSLNLWQIEYQKILINRNQLANKYKSYVEHFETQINKCLIKYREINQRHRNTPPPKYFITTWSFPEFVDKDIETNDLVKDFQDKLAIVYKNLEKIQKDIDAEVNTISSVISPVSTALGKNT